ncbi:MAG TPA: 4-(cytidine 5'-diphospho)-2-C-methyl-D-erythritol kinase [Dehalococcoidia bacterium]|nr:4-(cytidine 5'-diphospho)-2-C-methyl-D-erythritol kinase [Dehalococcoidia bacterium]
MSRTLRLRAPAKINWTLEVLRVRGDGYHEIRSVLQTVDWWDVITLTEAEAIELVVTGPAGSTLDDNPVESNLAYQAAFAFRDRTGLQRGVRITLDKHLPVAAGLGGGSSDGAAVLRGLNLLWEAGEPDDNLVEIAGEIGSDPPFFVVSGTASVRGRGDQVDPLRDAVAPAILLASPRAGERGDKTASMFRALSPDDFSDGYVTLGVRSAVEAGREISGGEMNNVFERILPGTQPETALAMDALIEQGVTPHLAGAGPSFFLLLEDEREAPALSKRITELGFEPRLVHALPRADALAIEEA